MPLISRCTIVIPCYNEAARLNKDAFKSYLSSDVSASIVFVNDGSTDGTLAVLQRLEDDCQAKVQILNNKTNSGKAEAVRQGILFALRDKNVACVGFWDADLATPLNAIVDLLAVLTSHKKIEIVLGARVRLMGRKIQRKRARHYLGRVFATFASMILNLPVYDTQCGAKLFRVTPTLIRVLGQPFLSKWIFDVEIMARFIRLCPNHNNIADIVYEYPLHCWKDMPGSKLRLRDYFRAALELLIIRRTYFSKNFKLSSL